MWLGYQRAFPSSSAPLSVILNVLSKIKTRKCWWLKGKKEIVVFCKWSELFFPLSKTPFLPLNIPTLSNRLNFCARDYRRVYFYLNCVVLCRNKWRTNNKSEARNFIAQFCYNIAYIWIYIYWGGKPPFCWRSKIPLRKTRIFVTYYVKFVLVFSLNE